LFLALAISIKGRLRLAFATQNRRVGKKRSVAHHFPLLKKNSPPVGIEFFLRYNASKYLLYKRNRIMDANQTHKRILQAALTVFSRYGYKGASTRAIAKEAGVNEVTLFRRFGNKQSLFAEMIENYSAIPYIKAARENSGKSLEKRINELGVQVIKVLEERRDLLSVLLSDGARFKNQGEELLRGGPGRVLEHLILWFREAKKAGEIRKIDPEAAARVFMGVFFFFMIFQKILPGEKFFPVNERAMLGEFVEIMLRGILPLEDRT